MIAEAVPAKPGVVIDEVLPRRPLPDHLRWQFEQTDEAVVPGDQLQVLVIDRDALGDIVQRGLKQDGFLRQLLLAPTLLVALQVGDVGIDADHAAVAGPALVDLHPAAIGQLVDIRPLGLPVFGQTLVQPTDAAIPDVLDGPGPDRLKRYLGKCYSGDDLFAEGRPEGQILAVAHDKAVVAVEQGEALVDGLDRLGQPGLDGFRQFLGAGEIAVGPLQLVQRALQFKRALAHLGFQHDGGLEQREAIAGEVDAALDSVIKAC